MKARLARINQIGSSEAKSQPRLDPVCSERQQQKVSRAQEAAHFYISLHFFLFRLNPAKRFVVLFVVCGAVAQPENSLLGYKQTDATPTTFSPDKTDSFRANQFSRANFNERNRTCAPSSCLLDLLALTSCERHLKVSNCKDD